MTPPTASLERYRKQMLFAGIGEAGQRRIVAGRVLLVGCGALGSVIADQLVRAGIGAIRIVDRDYVDLSNLQRQVLYDEQDVAERLPKSIAAARKLTRINSQVTIEPVVADLQPDNVLELANGVDLIMDGTDNFETRFLINDASLETGIPWINGGCLGSHGQVMAIVPRRTKCFRCLIEDAPEPGGQETCDTAGVLAAAVNVVASLQVVAALKLLVQGTEAVESTLTILDVWDGTLRQLQLGDPSDNANCPACGQGERAWLRGERSSRGTVLCGRNAVQLAPAASAAMAPRLDLQAIATRLESLGRVVLTPWLLRFEPFESAWDITLFPDGRAIIKGTEDLAVARVAYARFFGS